MKNVAAVDAIIDADSNNVATELADLVDVESGWDLTRGDERLAIVEGSHAWWLVCRGNGEDSATAYADEHHARAAMHHGGREEYDV